MRVVRIKNYGAAAVRQRRQAWFEQGRQRGLRGRPFKLIATATNAREFRRLRALRKFDLALLNDVNVNAVARLVEGFVRVGTRRRIVSDLDARLNGGLVKIKVVRRLIFSKRFFRVIRVFILNRRVVGNRSLFDRRAKLGGSVAFVMSCHVRFLNKGARRMACLVQRKARVPSVYRQCRREGITKTFAARFLLYGLCATAITGSAFVASALMFAAVTFVVLYKARSAFTRRAIALEFVDAMVSNFKFRRLAGQVLRSFFEQDRSGKGLHGITLCFEFFSGDRVMVGWEIRQLFGHGARSRTSRLIRWCVREFECAED